MFRSRARSLFVFVSCLLAPCLLAPCLLVAQSLILDFGALAHDSWISRGGLRNTAGEWCCGEGDCPALNYTPRVTASGYQLQNGEVVPFNEAQPSPDGSFVRCHRPDGSRRCFFAPPSTN
jgi:hypothetical protein